MDGFTCGTTIVQLLEPRLSSVEVCFRPAEGWVDFLDSDGVALGQRSILGETGHFWVMRGNSAGPVYQHEMIDMAEDCVSQASSGWYCGFIKLYQLILIQLHQLHPHTSHQRILFTKTAPEQLLSIQPPTIP